MESGCLPKIPWRVRENVNQVPGGRNGFSRLSNNSLLGQLQKTALVCVAVLQLYNRGWVVAQREAISAAACWLACCLAFMQAAACCSAHDTACVNAFWSGQNQACPLLSCSLALRLFKLLDFDKRKQNKTGQRFETELKFWTSGSNIRPFSQCLMASCTSSDTFVQKMTSSPVV